jgi:hypothetical protein
MHSHKEAPTALLGDSEIFAVKHTPCDTIPALVQRLEYDGKVSSSVASKQAVNVFKDNGSWQSSSNKPHKLVKESRFFPSKPFSRPHSCQAKVLAGEACGPNIGIWDVCILNLCDVRFFGDRRPVLAEDISAKRFDLALKRDIEASPLKTEVKPADSGEERRDGIGQFGSSRSCVC